MRHWSQLATRDWRTRPGRSALAVAAVMLGVGIVVWVTSSYESVRRSVTHVVLEWIGSAHVIVEPIEGVWAVFGEELEPAVAATAGVQHTTVRTREYVDAAPDHSSGDASNTEDRPDFARIEVTGVVPEKEPYFRTYRLAEGRFLSPADEGAIVVEKLLADEFHLSVGGRILLRSLRPPREVRSFTVVGIMDRRRASVNQAPMTWARLSDVQSLVGLPGKVKGIDVMIDDPSVQGIRACAERVRKVIEERNARLAEGDHETESLQVKTTETQHQKLGTAKGLLQFIMLLLSCVVLLTAFFIILASMSMGVAERITELGLLRCIGATRRQLAGLVLLQNLPLGIVGTLLGVPLGLFLQWLTIKSAREYLGEMAVSDWGMAMAVVGGIGTTLLGAAAPAFSALSVSPVDAARVHAGGRLSRWVWMCGIAGVALVAGHEWMQRYLFDSAASGSGGKVVLAVLLLYGGSTLIAPAAVVTFGRIAVWASALLLGIRRQLLGEQIDKAPFRSGAICCGLAVGLSLIVGLIVWGQSVKQGWEFPKEFPDAMLYSYDPLPLERVEALRDTRGITDFTVADDFAFSFSRPSRLSVFRQLSMLDQSSRFLAIKPDEALSIIKLAFIEGDEWEARAKLNAGGHVLVTREFSQARNLHLGDQVKIWVGRTQAEFIIAGVIGSPGVDIAISFFNASEFFQFYAVGAIFGSREDARRLFGRNYGKMMLFNFDLPGSDESRIVSSADQAVTQRLLAEDGQRQSFAMGPGPVPGSGPQEAVVNGMLERLGYPSKAFVTARELKSQIDRNINRVTLLLSIIPFVGLIIAALGVANLMAANVASRSRQIAVLRAIGVTKRQMARIVIGEALVLGLLGSGMGMSLGLLLARTSNLFTRVLSGFEPVFSIRWDLVWGGAGLATLLCIAAALLPAARASRSSIVSVWSSG